MHPLLIKKRNIHGQIKVDKGKQSLVLVNHGVGHSEPVVCVTDLWNKCLLHHCDTNLINH